MKPKNPPMTQAERKRFQRARQAPALAWYTRETFGREMSLDALATAIEGMYNEHLKQLSAMRQKGQTK